MSAIEETAAREEHRCFCCGRAASYSAGDDYLFGRVCDRARCLEVKQAFLDEYKTWWAAASLPAEPGDPGRPSPWHPDGRIISIQALKGDGKVRYPTGGDA